MKKLIALTLSIITLCLMFSSCGKQVEVQTTTIKYDSQLTSEWNLSYVKNEESGERTYASEFEDKSLAPYFMTPDGLNFLFTVDGVQNAGTIDYVDNRYYLRYRDNSVSLKAEENGNILKIYSSDGKYTYVFSTEQ